MTAPVHAPRVVAVVVSYNRAKLLAEALDALADQTRALDKILVVDNASTDDAVHVARSHRAEPDVVELERNTGGAGGFAAGIALAVADLAADLVWIMDDDTIPTPTALAEMLDVRSAYPGPVAALASRVVWTDGSDHPMNTPRRRPGASADEIAAASAVGAVPVRSMSFVSMLADADAVRAHGLPVTDYFLWNDDFEYSARLLRHGVGLYVPGSVVEHRTKALAGTDTDPGPRFYNEVRNKVWLLRGSPALGAGERVLYTGASLRRWARTFARSADRRTLVRTGTRGLWHGLARSPRPDAEVLRGLSVAETVARVGAGTSGEPARTISTGGALDDERFSVLLPVYAGDRAAYLERAFRSVTADQRLRPDEVVVVRDGPVGKELGDLLGRLHELTSVPVTVVPLEQNVGLAGALEAGLETCKYEIVARADADDISLPGRFATQVPMVRDQFDIVGSAIREFDDEEDGVGLVRVPPQEAEEIAAYARFHDPFNHPSVVYRKSAVVAAGGYEHLDLMEDYLLFARMLAGGARAHNVREPLVLYRVGAGAYARRGGRRLFRSEVQLQRTLRSEGFVSGPQYARNVVIRAGYRFVPEGVRKIAYRALTLRNGGYKDGNA